MTFIVLFWVSWLMLLYHLAGYPALLWILNLRKHKNSLIRWLSDDELPVVTVLCAAYNEEAVIGAKIESFLALDYPSHKVQMIIISDDSTDKTNEIVSQYTGTNVSLIVQKPRAGKPSGLNLALEHIQGDYVLSTDANSIFAPDALRVLVNRIKSDDKLGMVSGELRLQKKGDKQSGEGLYWRYEAFIKKMDSMFHSIICANGSLFLIKRCFFREVDPQSTDDFERTLIVLENGYYAAYEPDACVYEEESEKASQELKRKVRIISREWSALFRHRSLLNPFRFPIESFLLISHKLIRWLFFIFIIIGFVSSALLLSKPFFLLAFSGQVLVYSMGLLGLAAQNKGIRLPLTGLPAYITAMILASLMAFIRFISQKRTMALWDTIR
ncbi:MAG: glycosyltransferase family 2 protein [Candidatus Cloacimonadaceae bacterium]|nr:glycosyltransferase family 2 protein [Candidatus Cloacimonadota bacterium]